jgi:hypothetical protein
MKVSRHFCVVCFEMKTSQFIELSRNRKKKEAETNFVLLSPFVDKMEKTKNSL